MISVTSAQLSAYLTAFLWPLCRILALISAAPILGNQSVPMRVKIGLGVLITLVAAPLIGPMPAIEPWSGAGIVILVQQVLIGLAMGFVIRLVFVMVDVAGELIGLQMGLGFATLFNPESATTSPLVAQFYGLLAALMFLALNGHLLMIATLVDSFQTLSISATPLPPEAWRTIAEWGGRIFSGALTLALPLLAALLITNLALGILTRAAPQLNIFAVGLPLTLLVGFLVMGLSLPYMAPIFERMLAEGLQMMTQLAASR